MTLRMPTGVKDGTIVRVRGEGTPGVAGVRPAGDLRVQIRIRDTRGIGKARPTGKGGKDGRPAGSPAGGTIVSDRVIVTVDASGLTVRRRLADRWETALVLSWQRVRRLSFDVAPHDEVIALYAWTTDGSRSYAFDAGFLTRPQWRTLAEYTRAASAGTVTVDLASRDRPHL